MHTTPRRAAPPLLHHKRSYGAPVRGANQHAPFSSAIAPLFLLSAVVKYITVRQRSIPGHTPRMNIQQYLKVEQRD
jgi:hypothetical protein